MDRKVEISKMWFVTICMIWWAIASLIGVNVTPLIGVSVLAGLGGTTISVIIFFDVKRKWEWFHHFLAWHYGWALFVGCLLVATCLFGGLGYAIGLLWA